MPLNYGHTLPKLFMHMDTNAESVHGQSQWCTQESQGAQQSIKFQPWNLLCRRQLEKGMYELLTN